MDETDPVNPQTSSSPNLQNLPGDTSSFHGEPPPAVELAADDDDDDDHRYTSLKDIMFASTPRGYSSFNPEELGSWGEFDGSKIMIRNKLVKSAASIYLQSAAILATRNEDYLASFWEKVRRRAAATPLSCWNACFRNVFGFFATLFGGGMIRTSRRSVLY